MTNIRTEDEIHEDECLYGVLGESRGDVRYCQHGRIVYCVWRDGGWSRHRTLSPRWDRKLYARAVASLGEWDEVPA